MKVPSFRKIVLFTGQSCNKLGDPELCHNLLNYFNLLSCFVAVFELACIFLFFFKGPGGGGGVFVVV